MGEFLRALAIPSTWRMAVRNVFRNGRRTAIVVTAIAIGLGGLLVAMAVNYGMIVQMVDIAIESELGHVQIHGAGWAAKPGIEVRLPDAGVREVLEDDLAGLEAWAPRIRSEGLASSTRGNVGVTLVAIDPEREATVTTLADSVVSGAYFGEGRRRAVIGVRLANRLHVEVGDKIVVATQDIAGDMVGEAFRVAGLFESVSMGLEERTVFVKLGDGRRMLGFDQEVSEFVLVATRDEDAAALRTAVESRTAKGLEVKGWWDLRPLLQYMVDAMSQMAWTVYAAIFIAMAFGIANVLLMSVYERTREIGILSAIGMKPGRLVATLLVESLCLTALGVAAGLAIGFGGVELLADGIDLSRWSEGLTSFGVPSTIIPVLPDGEWKIPVVVALVTAILASLWPALRAVRTRPADAVRHV